MGGNFIVSAERVGESQPLSHTLTVHSITHMEYLVAHKDLCKSSWVFCNISEVVLLFRTKT